MPQLRKVTWSKAFTIVPTYECFNRCTYCNFRRNYPDGWITLSKAEEVSKINREAGAVEALILSGEVHPRSSKRGKWIEHIYSICKIALRNGLLPHLNIGPLSYEELKLLSRVSVSMGLMLEQVTSKLAETVHRRAPSKKPSVRLRHLDTAGWLKIPFTTGILLGLGENEQDREDTLHCIAKSHKEYGHIQECIIQPFCPGERGYVVDNSSAAFHMKDLPAIVSLARRILPKEIALQIPPNLVFSGRGERDGLDLLFRCLEAGASDLGGISPIDEVNPSYGFPKIPWLEKALANEGYELVPRLPVYERFIPWLQEDEDREYMCKLVTIYGSGIRETSSF
jgi:FO synthase subunit 1